MADNSPFTALLAALNRWGSLLDGAFRFSTPEMHDAVAAAHDAVVSAYGEIDPTVLADHLEVTAHWPGLAADPAGDVAGYFQEAVRAAHSVYGS